MRPAALVCCLLFALPALSGCLSGVAATAKELAPKAERVAEEWSRDARLTAIAGLEIREIPFLAHQALAESGANGSMQAALARATDGNVGDGRAPAWVFRFQDGSRSLILVLDGSGSVLFRDEDDRGATGSESSQGMGGWSIDSDRASDLAASQNGTFGSLRGHAAFAAFLLVPWEGKDPAWLIAITESLEGSGRSMLVAVGANNGTVMALGDRGLGMGPMGFGQEDRFRYGDSDGYRQDHAYAYPVPGKHVFLERESGSVQRSLSAASPDGSDTFTVDQEGHGRLKLALAVDDPLVVTAVSATVTGPDGKETRLDIPVGGTVGRGVAHAQLDQPTAGDYAVKLHLDQGVLANVRLDWCTDGIGRPDDPPNDPNEAC
jgi:hypothetical protein